MKEKLLIMKVIKTTKESTNDTLWVTEVGEELVVIGSTQPLLNIYCANTLFDSNPDSLVTTMRLDYNTMGRLSAIGLGENTITARASTLYEHNLKPFVANAIQFSGK